MRTNPGVKLTYDDFLLFPDDGKRHELIDGEHFGSPSARQRDETIAVYRDVGDSYQRVIELNVERNDTLTTPLLPGLQAPLTRIFKD